VRFIPEKSKPKYEKSSIDAGMSDLQLCGARQLRKHEVGFIANKNLFFPIDSDTYKFLCGKVKLLLQVQKVRFSAPRRLDESRE
jgi:hypothetical protein